MKSIFATELLSPRDLRHHLDKEQKTANILGRREKAGSVVASCEEWKSEQGGVAKRARWCGLQFAARSRGKIYEYRSGEM